MYNVKNDPFTNLPCFVVAYTIDEGGVWRYKMIDGELNLGIELSSLRQREDVLAMRVFGMLEAHRRIIVSEWEKEA